MGLEVYTGNGVGGGALMRSYKGQALQKLLLREVHSPCGTPRKQTSPLILERPVQPAGVGW